MNIHEYQSKEILQRYGVPISPFGVARTVDEVEAILDALGLESAVLKIQVHAGGRGKAGGVKVAHGKEEILQAARKLLGMKLINNQTGPAGVIAQEVLVTAPIDIQKEYYLGAAIDRDKAESLLIASAEGGMEIEEVAVKAPGKILKVPISLDGTLKHYHHVELADFMGWSGEVAEEGGRIATAVARAFVECDGSILEINPLAKTRDGKLWAIDAKLTVDDNALFRQKEIAAMYDATQVSANEAAARKHDLAYISLSGNIGCMVNGAGLAMATMDLIQYAGGKPANFLDVGGGASVEKVTEGFKIILMDPQVKAILVNIFGGIMDCAIIAEGIIQAATELSLQVPLIVRLEGTNVEKGRALLKESGLKIIAAQSLAEAATKAVGKIGSSRR